MAKVSELIINAPRLGIGPSPHTGYGDVRNLDITSVPGVAKLNNLLSKESSTTVDAQIKWTVKNPASPANLYAIDSNGVVYNSSDSGDSWSELSDRGGAGQGLLVWKDYLFVFETTTIDVYGPLSGSAAWSNDWQTIDSDALWHPAIISKNDGKIYFGAGRYVGSIEEVSGQNFAPGDSGTFTYTQQALDLPEDYRVKCLAELGERLLIGTWQGSNIYDLKIGDIFPWDRSSSSFNTPVQINEHGVHGMLTIGRKVYVLAGIEGGIYVTDGVNIGKIAQIPNSVADLDGGKYLEWYPGAIINYKGRPFFGVSGGSGAIGGQGIYSLMETSRGTVLNNEHLISTGSSGASNILTIGALLGVTRDTFIAGWRDNTTYGIDLTDASNRVTSYGGYFESPFYTIGSLLNGSKFSEMEIQLAKPLASNEGIRIAYRTDLNASFTNFGTDYNNTNFGTDKTMIERKIPIPQTEFLQVKVSLTGTTTTPHFKSLIFR